MNAISILVLVVTQSDRLLIARLLPIDALGITRSPTSCLGCRRFRAS
jgi:O-antigen/teichoic acid export membrane protein